MMLTCYCCRGTYERGQFRCCAPPPDVKAHRWREQFCNLCRKCPRHCECEQPKRDVAPDTARAGTMTRMSREELERAVANIGRSYSRPERNFYEVDRE